jgi:hypothetical protein
VFNTGGQVTWVLVWYKMRRDKGKTLIKNEDMRGIKKNKKLTFS